MSYKKTSGQVVTSYELQVIVLGALVNDLRLVT